MNYDSNQRIKGLHKNPAEPCTEQVWKGSGLKFNRKWGGGGIHFPPYNKFFKENLKLVIQKKKIMSGLELQKFITPFVKILL